MPFNLILIIFGLGILTLVIYTRSRYNHILAIGIETEGVVFDSDSNNVGDIRVVYPVIRFLTKENEWKTLSSNIGVPGMYKKGEHVTLYYDPSNTDVFVIKSNFTKIVFLLFTIISIIMIAVGILFLFNVKL